MRILLVVHQYLPRHRAGTELYTHALAKALSRRHQVLVYAHEPALDGGQVAAQDEVYDDVPVHRVAATGPEQRALPWQLFRRSYDNPRIEADYTTTLGAFAPDIVHIQHLKDLSVGILNATALHGIPLIMTLHDYWGLCPNAQCVRPDGRICHGTHGRLECGFCAAHRLGHPTLRWLAPAMMPLFLTRDRALRQALRHVQQFIAPSTFLRQQYIDHGYPADKILHLEIGIDLTRLRAAIEAPREGFRGHYAYLGSIAWQKGVHIAVDAFRQLGPSGAQLRIWGNLHTFPEYARNLQERAKGCSWIAFEGAIDSAYIGDALAWADYLIVPSLWWENSPTTIQEAYAAKVPVIASDLGAVAEKVQHSVTGLRFRPGDVHQLTATIQRTLREPELLQQLRANLPRPPNIADHAQEVERIYRCFLLDAHPEKSNTGGS